MSYPANIAFLSSGQLLFGDSSQPWDPTNFPTLPSTSLTLTAQGTAASGNLSTLTLTNSNIYEPFEPVGVRSTLKKQLQVSAGGLITFRETTLGYVSTIAPAFDAPVNSFQPSTIGGAGLMDALSGAPDTVTNGLAKLDAWIANAFLFQPPPISPIQTLPNSMFGSLQWTNFVTYAILDKFVPYVTSIVLIIGDPTTNDYCTLEIADELYFPYKTYTDGISPYRTPLVALQIFTDFFPVNAPISFSKQQLQSQCIRLVSESGNVTFPGTGKVVIITPTDGTSTYTTMSLYLPNLATAYPKNTPVPVSVVFLNNTSVNANVVQLSTIQTTTGGPSAPDNITVDSVGTEVVQLEVTKPDYSDANALLTTPFFSTYNVNYTFQEMATAHTGDLGFQYGLATPTTVPSTMKFYVGSTFQQTFVWNSTVQTVNLTGTLQRPLRPGVVFSTSTYAINNAFLLGNSYSGPEISTLFPLDTAAKISSVAIKVGDPTQARDPRALFTTTYGGQGWTVQTAVSDAVLFMSTVAPFEYILSTPVQFNDASYPGDQSGVLLGTKLTNPSGLATQPVTLTLTPTNYDYALGSTTSSIVNANTLYTSLQDVQSTLGYMKFFYTADISGAVNVSTISTNPFALQVTLSNNYVPDYTNPILPQILSTPVFRFQTEPANHVSTASITVTDVTSTIQISGIVTPIPSSIIVYDMSGTNFAHWYATSSFARAFLQYDDITVSPIFRYSTNVKILNNGAAVTTLPFPQNTLLTLSSLGIPVGNGIYVDPNDLRDYTLVAGVTPASPIPYPDALKSTLLSTLYVDTVSYSGYTQFMSTTGVYGQRVVSMLPNVNNPGSSNNIVDGVTPQGNFGAGLDVDISSFVAVTLPSTISLQSSLLYQHTSSLATAYPDFYSRELLYTSNTYIHPAGYNFAQFNGGSNVFPNFTYDLDADSNFGYRYATFAFEFPAQNPPQLYAYLNVQVKMPSIVSTIQSDRTLNNWWPNTTVSPNLTSSMKVRMHARLVGTFNVGTDQFFDTAWLNCMKQLDFYNFDDDVFDTGAAIDVSTLGTGDVLYKSQFSRRLYTKVSAFIRVGISQDGSQYSGFPITFEGLQASLTNS